MLTYMFITNNPQLARIAVDAGVQRIFVDWEILGKVERQGHLDTVISEHTFQDAINIKNVVPEAELLIRLNPININTSDEVELALKAGADLIMLPMFKTLKEVITLCRFVAGRARIVPLLETPEAIKISKQLADLDDVYELYVGLNDLHMALNLEFMFQPLADGIVDIVAHDAISVDKRFGFGGVARVGEGMVPGEMVLSEHIRLSSSTVILSRAFFHPEEINSEDPVATFARELSKLQNSENILKRREANQIYSDNLEFKEAVKAVVINKLK